MSLSARKQKRLSAFLGSLPTASALKLFAALEADRDKVSGAGLDGGASVGVRFFTRGKPKANNELPHDELLHDLRKRLVQRGAILPLRKIDARRIFFKPFEDFFIGAHSTRKRDSQISRKSLLPIWQLMMSNKMTSDATKAVASLENALLKVERSEPGTTSVATSRAAAGAAERALFIAAEAGFSRLCTRAEDDVETRDRLVTALGGEEGLNDFFEFRHLLEGVEYLMRLQSLVPNATPALTEEQFYELRTLFLAAHAQSRSAGVNVLLALKGRLEKPWRALGVFYHLAKGADDRLLAAKQEIMALPESLFEDIEILARKLERECAETLDANAAIIRISYFADFADGLARQSAKAGDNVYLNRIEACRELVGEALERFTEQGFAAVRAVLPGRHTGGSRRLASLRPDLSTAILASGFEDAAEAAQLISRAQSLAKRLGADQNFPSSIADDAAAQLQAYGQALVTEIRAAEKDERKTAQHMLENVLAVSVPLLKSEDIASIRDRANAAFMTV